MDYWIHVPLAFFVAKNLDEVGYRLRFFLGSSKDDGGWARPGLTSAAETDQYGVFTKVER